MDHSLYRFRARTQSPRAALGLWEPAEAETGTRPQGSASVGESLQAFVLLFFEHWEAEPAATHLRDPRFVGEFGSFSPDYRSWTQREYGLRVGIFRVLQALRDLGIRPAIAANAQAVQRLPRLVSALQEAGCEWVAHGVAATRMMHSRMSVQEQRAHIQESLDVLHAHTGARALGWLSQDWGTTPHTHQLLADAGLHYTLDWCNDDAPYGLDTQPRMMAIPLSAEWDDVQCQWLRHLSPREHASLSLQALDRLREECQRQSRPTVFGLPLHPWVWGMPSRFGTLRRLLADLRSRPGVQWVLPGEISAATRSAHAVW